MSINLDTTENFFNYLTNTESPDASRILEDFQRFSVYDMAGIFLDAREKLPTPQVQHAMLEALQKKFVEEENPSVRNYVKKFLMSGGINLHDS